MATGAVARVLLTCRQASDLTGFSEAYWRKKIYLREIQIVRIGRSVRIPASTIEMLIASGTVPPREQQ
jgi:excisionase family DNA binding protein